MPSYGWRVCELGGSPVCVVVALRDSDAISAQAFPVTSAYGVVLVLQEVRSKQGCCRRMQMRVLHDGSPTHVVTRLDVRRLVVGIYTSGLRGKTHSLIIGSLWVS